MLEEIEKFWYPSSGFVRISDIKPMIIQSLFILSLHLFTATAEDIWHPVHFSWDNAPVDLSDLLDAPAGKHGFLGVRGSDFIFEDRTRIRFWGTCMRGMACFPTHEQAPVIAERLSQFGINLVRFEDWLAPWVNPPLFMNTPDGIQLNPHQIDRLDYFIFQLANRGIYTYLSFPSELSHPELIPMYDSHIWTHRNRYTGKEYRDDPIIILAELFDDFFDENTLQPPPQFYETIEPFWKQWTTIKQKEFVPFDRENRTSDMQQFISESMGKLHAEQHHALRSESVKIPMNGLSRFPQAMYLPSQTVMDFVSHSAVWNPVFARFRCYDNRRMTSLNPYQEPNLFSILSFARLKNKPFLVSRWGNPYPNQYRAELPLWIAAVAGFQGWNGCISSSYSTLHDPAVTHIFAPYELNLDPCLIGLFPAAALLFHADAITPAKQTVEMALPEGDLFAEEQWTPLSVKPAQLTAMHRFEVNLQSKPSGSRILAASETQHPASVRKDKKQNLLHDPQRELVIIRTPGMYAAIGKLHNLKVDEFPGVIIHSGEPFGVISLTSLDKQPVHTSGDILITIISEAQNTGFTSRRENDYFIIDDIGQAPVLIKNTPARIFLGTSSREWTIRMLTADGNLQDTVPFQFMDNQISFEIGTHGVLYYRIQRQPSAESGKGK